MKRSASIAALAAASFALAACNDGIDNERVGKVTTPARPPATGAPGSTPAVTPRPSPAPAPSAAAKGGGPQVQLAADMELSSKVKEALQAPGKNRIEVAANDGVVTLYGTVDSPDDKDQVALAALEIEGVRSVVNNLVVMSSS
jgi:hypothetical protein